MGKRPKSARKTSGKRSKKKDEKKGIYLPLTLVGGKRRRTRKKRGKGPQQRAVAGKFVGNILSKYKPKARRKKTHTAKKADRMPAPGPPNKGDIVLANVNFGDGEGPQDKEGKFLGMTRYGGNFRVEFESPKQWIATEIRVVDEIKFNGEWWSLQGAPQFGGSRTRKKRGKGPQQRAVAGKFVGNILSKYKPKAKKKKTPYCEKS